MAGTDWVRVEGLREFTRGLKAMDRDLPKALRIAFNAAADIVVSDAKPRIPRRTGRAAGSVKARSTQTAARVTEGGPRAVYMPWLDFGGRVGINNSVRRPFLKDGRYLYPAYRRNKAEFADAMESAIVKIAKSAGIEVT